MAAQQDTPGHKGEQHLAAVACRAETWLKAGNYDAVEAAETAICEVSGAATFDNFLEGLASAPGQKWTCCVQVWKQGSIAYRCKTCQVGPASAVCPACFKAGGHENHDYIMYTSDAGGCCDCGDISSWKASGCCPLHRPPDLVSTSGQVDADAKLPENEERLMRELIASALASIVYTAEKAACSTRSTQTPTALHLDDFPPCLAWLRRCCEVSQLRSIAVEEMCRAALMPDDSAIPASCSSDVEPILSDAREVRMELCKRLQSGAHLTTKEILRHPSGKGGKCPLLTRLLHSVGDLWHSCLSDLTTLLMLMLYDSTFKYQFTRCLCPYYPGFMSKAIVNAYLRTTLDRLTVQLFSISSVTLRLVQEDNLLEFFLGLLHEIFKRASGGNPEGPVNALHEQLHRLRSHHRVLMDLKMVLCHTDVVVYLFTQNFRAFSMLLNCLHSMQGMCAHHRKSGTHIQQESVEWGEAILLEQQVLQLISKMMKCLTSMSSDGAEGSLKVNMDGPVARKLLSCIPPENRSCMDAAVASLAAGAELSLRRACLWAVKNGSAGNLSMPLIGKYLFDGNPVSVHLPLHRTAAACIQALMEISARGGAQAHDAKLAIELLMSGVWIRNAAGEALKQPQMQPGALVWQLVALHPLQILVWLAQVRARLWLRNGESLMKIDAYYRSTFWHDIAMDMDYLVLQIWLAAIPADKQSQTLMWILEAFGAQPMFRGMSSQMTQTKQITPMQISESQLACAIMGLKLVVTLMRESHLTCDPSIRLKHEIIHQLAVADQGHHQLCDTVAPERLVQQCDATFFDEVLSEVAVYVDPDLKQRGRYRLKKECWQQFDPLFLHYLPNELQEAMERAQSEGQYTPHLNLKPKQSLPQELANIHGVLSGQPCQRVIWTCLQYAKLFPSSGSYELVFVAVHLLALSLQTQEAEEEAEHDGKSSAMCSMMVGADPVCKPGGLELLQSLLPDIAKDLRGCVEHIMPTLQKMQAHCKCHSTSSTHGTGHSGNCASGCADGCGTPAPSGCCSSELRKRDSMDCPDEPLAVEEAERKRRARQRQQEMMKRMAMQQAAFFAQSESADGSKNPSADGTANGNGAGDGNGHASLSLRGSLDKLAVQQSLMGSAVGGSSSLNSMDQFGGSSRESDDAQEDSAPLMSRARAGSHLSIPRQHPCAWSQPSGECVFCHLDDPECGPLGRLCYVRVNPVPAYASRDYSINWKRLERWVEDAPAGGVGDIDGLESRDDTGSPSSTTSDSEGCSRPFDAAPSSYTAPSTLEACDQHSYAAGGPMLSEMDCRPGVSVLGCGHMMHFSCLQAYGKTRESPYGISAPSDFLCPICRRQSNAVLPAAGPEPTDDVASNSMREMEVCGGETDSLQVIRKSQSLHQMHYHGFPLTPQSMLEAAVDAAEQAASEATAYVASQFTPGHDDSEGQWKERLGERELMARAFLKQCQQQLSVATQRAKKAGVDHEALELAGDAVNGVNGGGSGGEPLHHDDEFGVEGSREGVAGASPSAFAWGVLSHNLVQWEILQRPMSGTSRISPPPHQTESVRTAPSRQADIMNTAYWRLLKGLTTLAMACGSEFHSWAEEDGMMEVEARALRAERASSSELAPWQEVLCWLMPREQPAAPPATPPIGVHTALCPRLKYDCRPGADSHRGPGLGPSGSTFPQPLKLHWPHIMGDPYALLMEVLALMMSTVCPREVVDPRAPTWVAPAGALAALLPVVYTIAVNQAAMLAVAICSTYDLTDSCGDPTSVFGFLMRELKRYLNEDQDRGGPGGHARLMEAIAVQVFPFLQRVTGLWALVTDGLEPKSAAPGAAGEDGTAGYLGVVECMAAALGLPSLAAALEVPNRHANPPVLLSHWCRRLAQQLPTISERALWLTRSRMSIPRTLRRPGLLPLPQLYHHLFLALGKCVCDVCGKPPKDPALCLSTGNFLCCDSHSGCLNHAWEHGAGTGIFLLIKTTQLLVIRNGDRACNSHPSLCLYLDVHGEEDPWMARGRPLHLSLPRYRRVASLWSAAAMDFDTAIMYASFKLPGPNLHPIMRRVLL